MILTPETFTLAILKQLRDSDRVSGVLNPTHQQPKTVKMRVQSSLQAMVLHRELKQIQDSFAQL